MTAWHWPTQLHRNNDSPGTLLHHLVQYLRRCSSPRGTSGICPRPEPLLCQLEHYQCWHVHERQHHYCEYYTYTLYTITLYTITPEYDVSVNQQINPRTAFATVPHKPVQANLNMLKPTNTITKHPAGQQSGYPSGDQLCHVGGNVRRRHGRVLYWLWALLDVHVLN